MVAIEDDDFYVELLEQWKVDWNDGQIYQNSRSRPEPGLVNYELYGLFWVVD